MKLTRLYLAFALCVILPAPLGGLEAPMEGRNPVPSEAHGNFLLGLGGLYNLAWEKGSPYEFSNPLALNFGLTLGTKWGPFWLDASGGILFTLGSNSHIDTINGQSGEFHREAALMQVGADVCFFISVAEDRFRMGPSGGCHLIYEEAAIYPPHGSIAWEISELHLEPTLGIQTEYVVNEAWTIAGSWMRYNTIPRFDHATVMILFPERKYPPSAYWRGCGIDFWLKSGQYKSVSIFFTVIFP